MIDELMDVKKRGVKKGNVPWNKGLVGAQVAWNKGRPHPENTKYKMSLSAKKRIGNKNAFYGKHHSEETKKKLSFKCGHISPWNKGKKLSLEIREKLSDSHVGIQAKEKHPNWRGGITPENFLIRNSLTYKQWRRTIFIRDEFTCQDCGKKHIYIVAHHIKPFAKFPELRFDISNGKSLCKDCHKKEHSLNGY